ncbi:MipA/OmpV family protein [Iodobacter fluviatilis]|jgi:outer membrane protein|uniref:MipA/OmpV family protein n=1 Tax=Iodobacter fluviatilis TaxID=537 RepID=A0A7G3GCY2_9NEIS|nr:MipA/OmpV family protein [Iodobacter fluviatilis]QBC44773.1 MipA/OmpV family protein [Iodobacter fluviatilis]
MRRIIALVSLFVVAPLYAADQPADESKITLAVGMAYGSEFVGGKKNKVSPLFYADYQAANGFFAGIRGIGFQVGKGIFDSSIALGYGGSRGDDIANYSDTKIKFKGMGDIKNSALLNLKAGVNLWEIAHLSLGAELKLNHRENGNAYNVTLAVPIYSTEADQISIGAFAHYADAKYAQTYYGVTAVQSIASGYKAYAPTAGFDTGSLSLTWNHSFDKNWGISSSVGVKRLFKNAENSPLTESKTSPLASLAVSYSF